MKPSILTAQQMIWMTMLDQVREEPQEVLMYMVTRMERALRAELAAQRPDLEFDPDRVHLRLTMEYLAPAREDL